MIFRSLGVKTNKRLPDDPYKGLTYYGVADMPLFAGRDSDVTAVSSMIGLGKIRILLLHGMTGCGKSSFLRAGLIPALEDEIAGYSFLRDENGVPAFVHSTDDPTASLARTVHQFVRRQYSEKPSTSDRPDNERYLRQTASRDESEYLRSVAAAPSILVQTVEQLASCRRRTLVLVIDQAEEIVTLKPGPEGEPARIQFFDFLADLSRSRHDFKLIITFRAEYHGQFYAQLRYGADVSHIDDYFLADFTRDQIIEAILRPTSREMIPGYEQAPFDHYRFEYEEGLPNQIADALLSSGVSGGVLPALQIVCRRLYEGARPKTAEPLGPAKTAPQDTVGSLSPSSVPVAALDESPTVRRFEIEKKAYTSLGGVAGQVDSYLQSELLAAMKEPFADTVGSLGSSNEILRWRKVLRRLVKPQLNGTVTSDVLPVGELTEEAAHEGCLIKPQNMFDFLANERRRILRPVAVTHLTSKAVIPCYSLGHDVLASALHAWYESQSQQLAITEAEKRAQAERLRAEEQAQLAAAQRELALKAEALAQEQQQRAEGQARQAKRFRRLSVALGGVLLLALAAIVFAFWQRALARARELVVASRAAEDSDPELSVLVGAQAVAAAARPWGRTVLPKAEEQLHRALLASHVMLTLSGHTAAVSSVAWSLDGKRLATGSWDTTARVWDAGSGKELLTVIGHLGSVHSVAWDRDGKRLATGSWDSTAKVWDATSGKELLTLRGHEDSIDSVAWSPDGTRLATASADKTAKVWDAATGKELRTLSGHTAAVLSVTWSPDGTRLATGSRDNTAKVWDVETGEELQTLRGHSSYVISVAWSPDSKRLATGSRDKTAKLWDASNSEELLTLRGHTGPVLSVAWDRDGKQLATVSWDSTAKVWDATSGKELLTLRGHEDSIHSVAWSPDGTRLATASADKTAKVWDAVTGKELRTLSGHTAAVLSVTWSPDGTRLATASADKTAKVWDAATGKELLTLSGHTAAVLSVAWSQDGTRLATASADKTAKVWDAATGKELLTLSGHTDQIKDVAWCPDVLDLSDTVERILRLEGKRLATGSRDQTVKVWAARSGKELLTLRNLIATPPETPGFWSVAWSPGGKLLAASTADATEVWDAATGEALLTLYGHTNTVDSVAWRSDGKRLATASSDGTTKVWDAATGKELRTLRGHRAPVMSVAWSPDGKRLATGSWDHLAKVWDAETGSELLTLTGHSDAVESVTWSPDGKRLATASDNWTVQVYAMDVHDLLTLARERVTAHPSGEGCKKYLHVDKCPPVPELSSW
jgi:WD40 repeat protein